MMPVLWLLRWAQCRDNMNDSPSGGLGRHVDGVSDDLFIIYTLICVGLIILAALMSGVSHAKLRVTCALLSCHPSKLPVDLRCMIDALCN